MSLILVEEHESPAMRLRTLACDCEVVEKETGRPGLCGTRYVAATIPGAPRDRLWLVGVIGTVDTLGVEIEVLLGNEPVEGVSPAEMIDRGLALVGLPWLELVGGGFVMANAQIGAWTRTPEWMYRLPREEIWRLRACVFGRNLSRVPLALWALHRMYVVEGPALEPWRS